MISKRILLGAATVLLLSLVGCGSSSHDEAATSDTFIAAVQVIVATAPDDTEPVSTDAIVATSPEDKEPASL